MSNLVDFPFDIFSHGIFPSLTAGTIRSFSRVSKTANGIVQELARQQPQDDITFEGKIVSTFLDGSVASFLRQRLKMQILTTRPELLNNMKMARDAIRVDKKITPNQAMLYFHAKIKAKDTLLPIVLFDFNTKKIPAWELSGDLLNAAEVGNLELVRMILSHPNAPNIDESSIRNTVSIVIGKTESVDIVLQCLSHPKMAKPGFPLYCAVQDNKLTLVKAILSHPNAAKIPVEGEYSLEHALRMVISFSEDPAIVRAIFSHPKAAKISIDRLSDALNMAVSLNKLAVVKEIRSHSNAVNIPTEVPEEDREASKVEGT